MRTYKNLSQIQEDLFAGKISCLELVNFYLSRIKEYKHLNAFLEVFTEEAVEKAKQTDEDIRNGTQKKLTGAVIGIKDVLCYKGHGVSAASRILENFNSLYTATAVQRLIDEGAIIIGRLNCDEFAMGSSNENSAYGNVLNFIDESRVPGGSSGGSAVAVQANLCLATLGTDTGGSIRQPASYCGVVGMKPTYGRISRYGLLAYASSFDQIGTFTHSVEDAAVLNEIMAGRDEFDSTTSSMLTDGFTGYDKNPGKYKIAWLRESTENDYIHPEIKDYFTKYLEKLKADGHSVEQISFPLIEYMVPVYYVLTTAEASSNLARYDGVHYGYRSSRASDMEEVYKFSRSEGFGREVKRRIMLGTFVLSSGYYDAYYTQAQKVRKLIALKTEEILKEHDFILSPTVPSPAFKIGEKTDDPVAMYMNDIFTVHANLAGIPAASLPVAQTREGLPFGLQLMCEKFGESRLFSFAHQLLLNKPDIDSVKTF